MDEARRARAFRFGLKLRESDDWTGWSEQARRAEALGYDTVLLPDHVDYGFAALPAALAAALATDRLRVGTSMLCNDFRHPAILAKEVATIDRLSGGRFELGLGAGWMREDYQRTGIARDPAAVRIERLEEALIVTRALLAGGPVDFAGKHYQVADLEGHPRPVQPGGPPLLVGGGGERLLGVAGRHADIVGINPTARSGVHDAATDLDASAESTDRKLGWLREAAGGRFDSIEIACEVYYAQVVEDPAEAARRVSERYRRPPEEARLVPNALVGSIDALEELLEARRERWSMSYWILPTAVMESMAPLVERLSGR
jgi:probable F420-dependent oxidoreductase